MELSWIMKLRIAAVAAVGIALIGILAWPLTESSAATGLVGFRSAGILVLLAFVAGVVGYFLSWPYGWEIGVLAAPFGLAVWSVRSGTMADLIRLNPTIAQRQELFASLRLQPFIWLLVVVAGFAGPMLCRALFSKKAPKLAEKKKQYNYFSAAAALVGSAFFAHVFVRMVAQDIRHVDTGGLGSVTAQPAMGQIAFAALVGFGFVAFLARKYLNAGYIWSVIATALLTAFAASAYAGKIMYMTQNWPLSFFPDATAAILPVQMVAFGTLGSITGYWMAERYDYWREHESV